MLKIFSRVYDSQFLVCASVVEFNVIDGDDNIPILY